MQNINFPKPGFYYHYKHDSQKDIFNYAYEVIGVGHHTETSPEEDSGLFVIYRPLYEDAFVYRNGKMFDIRPLDMFMEEVSKNGEIKKRFTLIEDKDTCVLLESQLKKMYS